MFFVSSEPEYLTIAPVLLSNPFSNEMLKLSYFVVIAIMWALQNESPSIWFAATNLQQPYGLLQNLYSIILFIVYV